MAPSENPTLSLHMYEDGTAAFPPFLGGGRMGPTRRTRLLRRILVHRAAGGVEDADDPIALESCSRHGRAPPQASRLVSPLSTRSRWAADVRCGPFRGGLRINAVDARKLTDPRGQETTFPQVGGGVRATQVQWLLCRRGEPILLYVPANRTISHHVVAPRRVALTRLCAEWTSLRNKRRATRGTNRAVGAVSRPGSERRRTC